MPDLWEGVMATVKGGLVHYQAYCQDCDWTAFTRNVLGIASIHATKKGHTVEVETGHAYKVSP